MSLRIEVGSRVIIVGDLRGNPTIFTGQTGKVLRKHDGKDRFYGYYEVQLDEPVSANSGRIVTRELFHDCELVNEALKPGKRVAWQEYWGRKDKLTGVIQPRHNWSWRHVAVVVDTPGPNEGSLQFVEARELNLI